MNSIEDVKPGDTLGRYELLAPVAQGGMAAVWAARLKGSRGFQRIVAIKTILPNLVANPMFEQMFLDEAELAARVRHPHVAQILDLGEEGDVLYLVMEWVDGESLSVFTKAVHKLTGKPVPLPIATRIVMQAAAGLHAAHELRDEEGEPFHLVHRDVSPQNILLTYDGVVKVVDFGVAKARTSTESTGQIKGKVPYMSPEQAVGGHLDRRTDIFALGTIFYLLAVGTHPFRGVNDEETLSNIVSRPALRPRLSDPSFPEEIENVLMTALAKDPNDRYPTMAAFEAALGEAIAKLGMVTGDTQVGELISELLGGRAKKRREALKQAMLAADEQAPGFRESTLTLSTSISQSGLSLAPKPVAIREAVTRPTSLSDSSSELREPVEKARTFPSKRAAIVVGAGALLALALIGFAVMTRSPADAKEAIAPPTVENHPAETAAVNASANPEPVVEEAIDEAKQEGALTKPVEGERPVIDFPAVHQAERVAKPSQAGSPQKPAAAAPIEKKPSATPKPRKKMPEVQDPGF